MNLTNDFEKLIENLPFFLQQTLRKHRYQDQMIEIVLDLGRRPEARFTYGPEYLSQKINICNKIHLMTKIVCCNITAAYAIYFRIRCLCIKLIKKIITK